MHACTDGHRRAMGLLRQIELRPEERGPWVCHGMEVAHDNTGRLRASWSPVMSRFMGCRHQIALGAVRSPNPFDSLDRLCCIGCLRPAGFRGISWSPSVRLADGSARCSARASSEHLLRTGQTPDAAAGRH